MKKILFLLCCALVLAACNSNDVPVKEEANETKTEKKEMKEVTFNEALLINKEIFQTLKDAWFNDEAFVPVFDESNRNVLADNLMDHYEGVLTEKYLNDGFYDTVVETCNACEASMFGEEIEFADEVDFKVTGKDTFEIYAHFPASLYMYELDVTYQYVREDSGWLLNEMDTVVLSEETEDEWLDEDSEYEEPQYSGYTEQALKRYEELKDLYIFHRDETGDMSEAETTDYIFDIYEQVKVELDKIEKQILTKNPYFERNFEKFDEILQRTTDNNMELYRGGSGQGRYTLEAELSLSLSRLSTLIYVNEDLRMK